MKKEFILAMFLTFIIGAVILIIFFKNEPSHPSLNEACINKEGIREWEELDDSKTDIVVCLNGESVIIKDQPED